MAGGDKRSHRIGQFLGVEHIVHGNSGMIWESGEAMTPDGWYASIVAGGVSQWLARNVATV
jgi:hypothetical protein